MYIRIKTPNNSNYKGFLLIELLVALGVLGVMILSLSKYQCNILLYKKAAEQLYTATNLCSDVVEELWAGKRKPESFVQRISDFDIEGKFLPGVAKSFWYVNISAKWRSTLGSEQKIALDVVCAM